MAYYYFMAGTMLPVPPEKFTISIPSKNEVVTLINDGDINILKKKGLKEFEFEMYLPMVKYPFADYSSGYTKSEDLTKGEIIPPLEYLQLLEKLKDDKLPFQLDIYRALPTGVKTWCTNETVSLEDYTVEENANNGFDVVVDVKLKQYKHYATQKVILSENGLVYSTVRDTTKKVNRIVQVRAGDTLPVLLQREFGYVDAELINKIVELNKNTLIEYNKTRDSYFLTQIYEGMTLRMTEV